MTRPDAARCSIVDVAWLSCGLPFVPHRLPMTSRMPVARQSLDRPLFARRDAPPANSARRSLASPPPLQPAATPLRPVPRTPFNTPIPRTSKQLSLSQPASPGRTGSSVSPPLHHQLLLPVPSAPPLSEDEKDKRPRSALPVFVSAAAVACVLILLLLLGLNLPLGAPLIVLPHPPALALLRDRAARTVQTGPAEGAMQLNRTSTAMRLKQRVSSEQQADSVQSAIQLSTVAHQSTQAVLTATHSAADSPSWQPRAVQQSQPLQTPHAAESAASSTSLLSSPPLHLSAYYERDLSVPFSFHGSFFNEPYMRDRNAPTSDRATLASNRALPHTFPAPLPFAPALLSSSVVIGVFCYNVARIEVLLDTWGKWLLPAHLMIFSEPSSDQAAQRRQESLTSVIIMHNDANAHRNVTDRRASAWKILPAVRLMYERHPASPWYYLCDDDSFPIVPNLAHFTANFYSAWPAYTPQHAMYVGESVHQQTFYKGYYADEKVAGAHHTLTRGGAEGEREVLSSHLPCVSPLPSLCCCVFSPPGSAG